MASLTHAPATLCGAKSLRDEPSPTQIGKHLFLHHNFYKKTKYFCLSILIWSHFNILVSSTLNITNEAIKVEMTHLPCVL